MADVVERLKPWATDAVAPPAAEPVAEATQFDLLESYTGSTPDPALSFLADEPSGGSLSQISQRTDPMSAAAEETMPDVDRREIMPNVDRRRLLRPEPDFPLSIVLAVLLPIVLAAAVLVMLVLWQALR